MGTTAACGVLPSTQQPDSQLVAWVPSFRHPKSYTISTAVPFPAPSDSELHPDTQPHTDICTTEEDGAKARISSASPPTTHATEAYGIRSRVHGTPWRA